MSGKPVVMVLGASGNIGAAALRALTSQYADKFDIRAGVRNPDKADSIKDIKGKVETLRMEICWSRMKALTTRKTPAVWMSRKKATLSFL